MSDTANAIDKELYSYFMQLSEAEKKSILEMLKAFLKARGTDIGRISIEQYNKELDEAEAEFEKGD